MFWSPGAHLRREVVLLQLTSLSQIPRADGVIQASRPKLGAIIRDVYAARSIGVALELSAGYAYKPIRDKSVLLSKWEGGIYWFDIKIWPLRDSVFFGKTQVPKYGPQMFDF